MLMRHLANSALRLAGNLVGLSQLSIPKLDPLIESSILFLLVSVDLEYHDGWCALKSPRIRVSGVVRRCSIEDVIPITARAAWRDVDVGNDQLRIPYIHLYGKFFQVGTVFTYCGVISDAGVLGF